MAGAAGPHTKVTIEIGAKSGGAGVDTVETRCNRTILGRYGGTEP